MTHGLTRRQVLASAAAMAAAACAPGAGPSAGPSASADAVAPLKWLFGFTVQANPSMPVILAKELGYYDEQKLAVNWDFTTDSSGIRLIGVGQYQAGSVSDVGAIVDFISQGVPLKAILQQSQNSARAFAVRKGSGIKRPKDFEGKRVGIRAAPWVEYLAMLAYDKVDRSKVKEIPIGFAAIELKQDLIDVMPIFKGVEPFLFQTTIPMEYELIIPSEWGFPSVGTIMVANANVIKEKPDVVLRFVKSFLKGAEFFTTNKDRTVQITRQYAGPGLTKEGHEFIYDVTLKDMLDGEARTKGIGAISRDKWQQSLDVLSNLGLAKSIPKLDDLIDTTFFDKAVKDGKLIWP